MIISVRAPPRPFLKYRKEIRVLSTDDVVVWLLYSIYYLLFRQNSYVLSQITFSKGRSWIFTEWSRPPRA